MEYIFGRGYPSYRTESVNLIEASHDVDPPVGGWHTDDQSDSIENDGNRYSKIAFFFRELFGFNTSRIRDVETGDGALYEDDYTPRAQTWTSRKFETLCFRNFPNLSYRSNWVRHISWKIETAIGRVSSDWMDNQ
jgi:hypothetical protein